MWLSPNASELQDSKLLCDEGRGFACLVRQGTSPRCVSPRAPAARRPRLRHGPLSLQLLTENNRCLIETLGG